MSGRPEREVAETHRRPWGYLRVSGLTLVLVGWVTTVFAGWWVPVGVVPPDPDEAGLRVFPVIVGGLLVAWGIVAIRARRDVWAPVWPVVCATFTQCVLAAWATTGLHSQLADGWAGPGTTAAAIGGTAGIFGALLMLTPGRRRSIRRLPTVAAVTVTALLASGVAAAGAIVWAPVAGLTATTAAPAQSAALPDDLSAEAWRAEMPSSVVDVVQAGPGVVVRVADGVVAVDGETGEERWRYLREGAVAMEAEVSPDGRTVMLGWRPGGDGWSEFVFLDASTGRELHREKTEGSLLGASDVAMSRESYVGVDEGEGEASAVVTGYAWGTGEAMWEYEVPLGCTLSDFDEIALDGPFIVPMDCREGGAATARFVAFGDAREPLWEQAIGFDSDVETLRVWPSSDGAAFYAGFTQDSSSRTYGLDFSSGEVIPLVSDEDTVRASWYPGYEVSTVTVDGEPRLEVSTAAGDALGTVVSPCVRGVVSDLLIACARFGDGVHAEVHVSTFSGEQRVIEIDLGDGLGPAAIDGCNLERVPGAWVLWGASVEGRVIVGLR